MLSNRIREARLARGLTQMELATRSGVSRRTVQFAELADDYNLTLDTMRSLAHALDVPLAELLSAPEPLPEAVAP